VSNFPLCFLTFTNGTKMLFIQRASEIVMLMIPNIFPFFYIVTLFISLSLSFINQHTHTHTHTLSLSLYFPTHTRALFLARLILQHTLFFHPPPITLTHTLCYTKIDKIWFPFKIFFDDLLMIHFTHTHGCALASPFIHDHITHTLSHTHAHTLSK